MSEGGGAELGIRKVLRVCGCPGKTGSPVLPNLHPAPLAEEGEEEGEQLGRDAPEQSFALTVRKSSF